MRKLVAVKYCGGCNPHYDRLALTAKLFEAFPQLAPASASAPDPWLELVVSGCSRNCAEPNQVQTNIYTLSVCDALDCRRLFESIKAKLSLGRE